jgi:hypothetical protein
VDWFDTERGPIFFSDVYSDPDGDPMPLAEQVDELVLQHQMDGGHDIDKKPVEGCPICVALTSLRRLP